MIFRIPSGKHRARPLRFGLWWKRHVFAWRVEFTESCRYDLQTDDQLDVNKLIGIGYLPGHHKHSARFGWRYWTDRGEIELSAYCYLNGRRLIQHIGFCEIENEYRFQLNITRNAYVFDVYDTIADKPVGACSIPHLHNKKLQYRLGTYFGGQSTAQHEIEINLERG
jgi:hypothetical protein